MQKGPYQILELTPCCRDSGRVNIRLCFGSAFLDDTGLPLVRIKEQKIPPVELGAATSDLEAFMKAERASCNNLFILNKGQYSKA